MKNDKCRKILSWMGSLSAVAILLVGILMIFFVFYTYNGSVLSNQDAQMLNWVRVLDSNVADLLVGYQEQLNDLSARKGMERTLHAFVQEGDEEEFFARLNENLITGDSLIEAMLVEKDGEILYATSGRTDYRVMEQHGDSHMYTNGDGAYFIAFRAEMAEADYVALLNLEEFYTRLRETLPVAEDRLMLLEYEHGLLIHQRNGATRVDLVEQLDASACDYDGLQAMLDSCTTGETRMTSYPSEEGADPDSMRMAVLPLQQTRNGRMAVALSVNMAEILTPLETGALKLMLFSAQAMFGAFLLIVILIHTARRDSKTEKELKLLREKNAEMEKLTHKTLELAHHQRLETIGTLTSSIAHEFNNLLTPIMGYSMMTLEKLPPECEELSDNVLEIYNASRKAKVMITRLNELARKGSDQVNTPIHIDAFVRKVMAAAHPGKPKLVQTEMRLNCGDRQIHGNEIQLTQLLLNLVLNGFQAMEDGEGRLMVETQIDDAMAVIRVIDQGVGIPKEKIKSIFEPFFTTKGQGKGTGLGLAIAQQAAEAHNGVIEVESTVGQGTVFTVKLPLLAETEPQTE